MKRPTRISTNCKKTAFLCGVCVLSLCLRGSCTRSSKTRTSGRLATRAPVREGLRREWEGLQFFDAVHLVSNWCNHLSRGGQSIMSAAACERRCEASPGMNRCQPAAERRHSSRRVAVTASVFFYFPLAVMSLMSRSPNPNVIFIKSYSPRVFFLSIKMTFSGA